MRQQAGRRGVRVRALGIAAILLLCVRPGFAAGWEGTGAELETLCTAPESTFDSGACAGYVLAIADILKDAPKGVGFHGKEACFPPAVRVGQLVDAVLKFLRQHKEARGYNAWSLTANAFAEAFPCSRK